MCHYHLGNIRVPDSCPRMLVNLQKVGCVVSHSPVQGKMPLSETLEKAYFAWILLGNPNGIINYPPGILMIQVPRSMGFLNETRFSMPGTAKIFPVVEMQRLTEYSFVLSLTPF